MAKKTDKKRKTISSVKKKKSSSRSEWPKYPMRFDIEEIKNRLRINRNALDDEVEQQAELYNEVAEQAAYAKSNVDSLEEELKELESAIDKEIRADAEKHDERITENYVKNNITGDKRRKKMVIQLLQAKDLHRRLDALTTAFKHRSYAMRDVVDLYLSSYYSSHSASGAREDRRDAEVERTTTRMKERRAKRVTRHRSRGSDSN